MIAANTEQPGAKTIVQLARPFVNAALVQFVFNCGQEKVLWMVEEGKLTAVDLRTTTARSAYLRILSTSVVDCLNGLPVVCDPDKFRQTVESLLPAHQNPTVAAMAAMLTVGSDHIYRFIAPDALQRVGPAGRPGRGGSPRINRASAVNWLCRRLVS